MPWTLLLCCCLMLVLVRLLIGLIAGTLLCKNGNSLKTMIVLGSGGHTAEMMALLKAMDNETYSPRCYVVAETDSMSGQKAHTYEAGLLAKDPAEAAAGEGRTGEGQAPRREVHHRRTLQREARPREPQLQKSALASYRVIQIPRSREVGQSFVTSIWTTLHALWHAVAVVLAFRPDLVLVNGPGTCIPICMAAVAARLAGVARGRVMYVESIARVYRLSLTGKILYHGRLAARFFVQWPDLQRRYPRSVHAGRVM